MGDAVCALSHYRAARRGFAEGKAWGNFVMASLDEAILLSKNREPP